MNTLQAEKAENERKMTIKQKELEQKLMHVENKYRADTGALSDQLKKEILLNKELANKNDFLQKQVQEEKEKYMLNRNEYNLCNHKHKEAEIQLEKKIREQEYKIKELESTNQFKTDENKLLLSQ